MMRLRYMVSAESLRPLASEGDCERHDRSWCSRRVETKRVPPIAECLSPSCVNLGRLGVQRGRYSGRKVRQWDSSTKLCSAKFKVARPDCSGQA